MKKEPIIRASARPCLDKLLIVGDKVLILPKKEQSRTAGGLYLPDGIREKEKIRSGYVAKVGPGYPMPHALDEAEAWKPEQEEIKYVPLQVKVGDLAIFLQKHAFEVFYEQEKYCIVPQQAILMLERPARE